MRKISIRIIFILSTIILLNSLVNFYQKITSYPIPLPLLKDHLYPNNFSSFYENIVLLSCSSNSYTNIYCYYLPYIALAWRRIGFEPFVFLVGSNEIFNKMPLINLLKNDLKIQYYYINVDSLQSISTSQIIRLFGGFISFNYNTTKDLFILTADVDLLPISRHRFEINTNDTNYILAVNAYCCPRDEFSYENLYKIRYYPMSYIGMTKYLWKKIFLPLNNCSISSNITIDMIKCCLKDKMNIIIPTNVIKASKYWDIDQKLVSILITRAERFYHTYIDKRMLGHRLDPNKKILSSEMNSILFYDDIHLPNTDENIIFSNRTWLIFSKAFSHLFNYKTIQILSNYHHQTTADVLRYNNSTSMSRKNNPS